MWLFKAQVLSCCLCGTRTEGGWSEGRGGGHRERPRRGCRSLAQAPWLTGPAGGTFQNCGVHRGHLGVPASQHGSRYSARPSCTFCSKLRGGGSKSAKECVHFSQSFDGNRETLKGAKLKLCVCVWGVSTEEGSPPPYRSLARAGWLWCSRRPLSPVPFGKDPVPRLLLGFLLHPLHTQPAHCTSAPHDFCRHIRQGNVKNALLLFFSQLHPCQDPPPQKKPLKKSIQPLGAAELGCRHIAVASIPHP
uniref:Uncharacterized protein n=1 Tax=Sphaerodactylus townsendi TaxID=933632 RepID=A0ACB8F1D7_9SAUR